MYYAFLRIIILCGLLVWIWLGQEVKAGSNKRYLPKAGFQTFARPPTANKDEPLYIPGVHLTPGLDRKEGEPTEAYKPGEPSQNWELVRWDTKKMPLLIWISPGLKLPDCPLALLRDTRIDLVSDMLRQPQGLANLPQAPGWSPEVNMLVATGFEQWREFEVEGLLSFGFIDDPSKAHILVFFTDHFQGAEGPGGTNVHGNTCAKIYPAQKVREAALQGQLQPQTPVIIELVVNSDNPQNMQADAAHEFGHALGIKAHSPYRNDIMYENRIVNTLSSADKATIRYLYRAIPKWVM